MNILTTRIPLPIIIQGLNTIFLGGYVYPVLAAIEIIRPEGKEGAFYILYGGLLQGVMTIIIAMIVIYQMFRQQWAGRKIVAGTLYLGILVGANVLLGLYWIIIGGYASILIVLLVALVLYSLGYIIFRQESR